MVTRDTGGWKELVAVGPTLIALNRLVAACCCLDHHHARLGTI